MGYGCGYPRVDLNTTPTEPLWFPARRLGRCYHGGVLGRCLLLMTKIRHFALDGGRVGDRLGLRWLRDQASDEPENEQEEPEQQDAGDQET